MHFKKQFVLQFSLGNRNDFRALERRAHSFALRLRIDKKGLRSKFWRQKKEKKWSLVFFLFFFTFSCWEKLLVWARLRLISSSVWRYKELTSSAISFKFTSKSSRKILKMIIAFIESNIFRYRIFFYRGSERSETKPS